MKGCDAKIADYNSFIKHLSKSYLATVSLLKVLGGGGCCIVCKYCVIIVYNQRTS